MKQLWQRLQQIQPLYRASLAILIVSLGVVVFFALSLPSPQMVDQHEISLESSRPTSEPCTFHRALDGMCVSSADREQTPFVAVMVENHYDARPLSGLSRASVVYEAPVEANFTRFLAIFSADEAVEKVGPVRSARPYYLDWVSEYPDALYMHVGGSPDALALIKQYDLFDMNEMFRGWYFWRSSDRYAPHNTYTSSMLWKKALEDYTDKEQETRNKEQFDPWIFGDMNGCEVDCVEMIEVTFSGEVYRAVWKYSTSTEQYTRYELGDMVVDREDDTPIIADTVIVQYVDTTVLDGVGRLGMDTIGSGKAIVFRNGYKIEGTWKKESRTGRTRFLDAQGTEIPLQAGKIWVEVVNRVDGVTIHN